MFLYNGRIYSIENQNTVKIKKFLFLIIFILITSLPFFLLINIFLKKGKISNKKAINDYNINIRDTLEKEKEIKTSFLSNLTDIIIEGKWKDDKNNNGLSYIYFSMNEKLHPSKLSIIFRLIHGNTIENWIFIYSTIYIKNIYFLNNNLSNIAFNAFSSNSIEIGKIFKKEKFFKIDSFIHFNITQINSSINKMGIIFNMNNTNNIFLNLSYSKINNKLYDRKIKEYTIILSIIVFLVFIINQITIKKVNDSISNGKSISIIHLYINLIWSSYGCFFHFYLILTDDRGFKYFCFLGAIFFINFSLTDYRFLDIILKIKNNHLMNNNYEIYRKKIIRFYLLSYLVLFFLLNYMVDFIFNVYISIIYIILTWLPQIVHNCYYYNRTSLPYSYIIINSLFRLFPSLYFFLYKNNFMFMQQKISIVCINIFLTVSFSIFMQIQVYKGPRFFLPNKYHINKNSLYKTKIELLNENINLPNECSICLEILFDPILDNSNNNVNLKTTFKNYNKINKERIHNVDIKEYENNLNVDANKEKLNRNKTLFKRITIAFFKSFNFFTISNNKYNKEYIITPCNHVFHSICLEKWFENKKECPFCRNEFDLII